MKHGPIDFTTYSANHTLAGTIDAGTQSGQITGSGTAVPDLVIFSFILPFLVFGDLIKFLEINSFSNIYETCYKV